MFSRLIPKQAGVALVCLFAYMMLIERLVADKRMQRAHDVSRVFVFVSLQGFNRGNARRKSSNEMTP